MQKGYEENQNAEYTMTTHVVALRRRCGRPRHLQVALPCASAKRAWRSSLVKVQKATSLEEGVEDGMERMFRHGKVQRFCSRRSKMFETPLTFLYISEIRTVFGCAMESDRSRLASLCAFMCVSLLQAFFLASIQAQACSGVC